MKTVPVRGFCTKKHESLAQLLYFLKLIATEKNKTKLGIPVLTGGQIFVTSLSCYSTVSNFSFLALTIEHGLTVMCKPVPASK
jgi:hypothetical protein